MWNIIPIIRFIILLAISELCETSENEKEFKYSYYREIDNSLDYMSAFNDLGFVQIEVPGGQYQLEEIETDFGRSYKDSKLEFQTSTQADYLFTDDDDFDESNEIINSNKSWNVKLDSNEDEDFLSGLQGMSLETARLHNISSATFRWLSNTTVQFLNMRYTDIDIVAEDTLEPLQSTLKVLDLAHATIRLRDLRALMEGLRNDTTEGCCSTLIVLSLAGLGLRTIPYRALIPVQYSLMSLSMVGNDFRTFFQNTTDHNESSINFEESNNETVEENGKLNYFSSSLRRSSSTSGGSVWAAFPQMPSLIELDLRQCNINSIEQGSFVNLSNLKRLRISGNNIFILREFAFEGLVNLVSLDISVNSRNIPSTTTSGIILASNTFAELFSLQRLNLSFTRLHSLTVEYLRRLPRSLTRLELRNSMLSISEEGFLSNLRNLQVLDISNNVGLATEFTTETFKGLDMLQVLHMARTSLHSLDVVKELSSLRYLDVSRNNVDTFGDILKELPLLEHLDIRENYINSWSDTRAFSNSPKLQSVYLQGNILSLMSEVMLEDFKSLSYLTLANNSFICNCQLKYFMEYLIDANNGTVEDLPILIDYSANSTDHVCRDPLLSKTFRFGETEYYCIDEMRRYWLSAVQHSVYITILILVCSASLAGLINRKWWYIRYVAILIKNATVLSIINVKNCEDRIYVYDIFVSYSDENRNWVIEELIPNLEGPEARFSICLHERDFQVGVGILENIITGMDESRTILLIISGYFLKSQWCQFEMHMAQHRLLETCREELVLVLLEDIPRAKRPKLLRYLMMVKTYIVWPKNNQDITARKLFWKRLRRAITVNKSKDVSIA